MLLRMAPLIDIAREHECTLCLMFEEFQFRTKLKFAKKNKIEALHA
jgi:hypothetical protein